MAKINEQTKVQLLEEAVLSNDLETVKTLFKEYGNFEFTARALGLACRYAGIEMVELLIKNKATFEYDKTPAMVKKYKFKHDISNNESYYTSFEFFVIEKYTTKEKSKFGYTSVDLFGEYESKNISLLSLDERWGIANTLLKKHKSIKLDVEELAYTAICFNDKAVITALRNCGLLKLSAYRKGMLNGQISWNQLSSLGRYEREEFRNILLKAEPTALAERLKNICEAMCDEKIKFTKSYVYEESIDSNPDVFYSKYCAAQVFDLLVKNSNLVEVAKKADLLYALIEQNNAEGLSYAFEEQWVTKEKEYEKLLNYAQEKKASVSVAAIIMEHLNCSSASSTKKEIPFEKIVSSASELKKIWGTKKKDDGTLIITSYKGLEKEVVIPSSIGKNFVTEIDSNAFSVDAPRLTKEQIEVRCAITSITIPGTVKTIPDNMFAFSNSSLEEILLEEGVETIGAGAFAGCKKLKMVSLPSTIIKIIGSFKNCISLKEIQLPEGLNMLGNRAFSGCASLTKIDIPKGITKLENGVFSRCGFEEFTIPQHITSIGVAAFNYCEHLKTVVFHNKITYIDDGAFSYCSKLEKLINLSSETKFGEGVLEGCRNMVDENGFIILNGEIQDVVIEDNIGALEVPNYISNISNELLWKLPRFVYKKGSITNLPTPDLKSLNIGDEFEFGQFPLDKSLEMKPLIWVVISKEEEKLLVITKDSIVSLHDTYNMGNCIWSSSPLREWLNSTFYQYALSDDDKISVVETLLSNPDNKKEKISGGLETKDKIFLLSIDEIEKYFPDMSKRTSDITSYALTQSYAKRDSVSSWLTRTPSSWLYAKISNFDGVIDWKGNRVGFNALRPAMWLKI